MVIFVITSSNKLIQAFVSFGRVIPLLPSPVELWQFNGLRSTVLPHKIGHFGTGTDVFHKNFENCMLRNVIFRAFQVL